MAPANPSHHTVAAMAPRNVASLSRAIDAEARRSPSRFRVHSSSRARYRSALSGIEVQAPVVEREGWLVRGREIQERPQIGFVAVGGYQVQLTTQADAGDEFAVSRFVSKRGRRRLESDLDIDKTGGSQESARIFNACIAPRFSPASEVRSKLRLSLDRLAAGSKPRQICTAASLRHQASAEPEHAVDLREQTFVIRHPVKGGGAEHRVERSAKRQRGSVGVDELRAVAKMPEGFAEHRRRAIEPDDEQAGGASCQFGRQPAGAATDIQDAFAGSGGQTLQHTKTPGTLRVGEAVVPRRIPI